MSEYLGILFDAGMVDRRKEGLRSYYRGVEGSIFDLCDLVCGSIPERLEAG
ncbi:MAG: hypothetical protein WA990_11410 [Rubrobacteraceae bacterium]